MVQPLIIGILAIMAFVFLKMLFGGTSYQARHSSAEAGRKDFAKVEAYENQINRMQRLVRTAPNDRQREIVAKRMELLLKQKERLKHKTERLVKKS